MNGSVGVGGLLKGPGVRKATVKIDRKGTGGMNTETKKLTIRTK